MAEPSRAVYTLAERVVATAIRQGLTFTVAESCTGGLVCAALTSIPGSSAAFDRGYITYSNAAKCDELGVKPAVIASVGAVSEPVAREMASGALSASGADIALSITGIAGPGGSDHKPAGLVWFGRAGKVGGVFATKRNYGDIGRSAVREAAVLQALELLLAGMQRS